MFIYTLRASTLKFFGVIGVALVCLVALVVFIPDHGTQPTAVTYQYEKVKTDDDVEKFLATFGWEVGATPSEVADVAIPAEFDKVFAAYNEIQKRQGLDLAKYRRKEVKRYTYEVLNYEGYEGKVYANVLVYRDRVIGGDICSADTAGFIHGFEK